MTTRMLIDARHQEETRVAVLKGNRIEEFDFESADHKQIKGNIYLAKVTRVEPSLQAAFVDYGGNRHGFLAFSEIHPDYYQIPREDRERLLAEEAQHAEEEAALRESEEDEEDAAGLDREDDGDEPETDSEAFVDELAEENGGLDDGDDEPIEAQALEDSDSSDDGDAGNGDEGKPQGRRGRGRRGKAKGSDEARSKRMALRRRYKIQDVIHRRQVLLVQIVKEERGNKGAALTTYLSLAGRYCVLMPNSSHGGGISRKISNASDRKRLKTIIAEMKLPSTMGCIVRTAGLQRTKTEIKRDFDYLARLWDEIRERTLKASAPAEIHSDSDLIKRAIRDIYNRDIEEVLVEGEAGYRAAKDFMKLLMPSHARRVKSYADPVPLFQRYGAEDQLSAMYEPVVQLKSGGYLVINPTEALVSIDINSGRSTKEHGIEQTAVNTNLEAAREIARQLRLRDMAGLVVIDFIDMEYSSNIRKVERAMKDALKNDRARIQVGRISGFGLMEMSRQRLRTGVLEASTRTCPHCEGTGLVRTASSAGLSALRMLEDEAAKGKGNRITLRASHEATIYVLNNKRADIAEIEERYGVKIEILPDGEQEGARMEVASSGPKPERTYEFTPIVDEDDDEDLTEDEDEQDDREERQERSDRESGERGEGRSKRRRRRRGKRGKGSDRPGDERSDDENGDSDADSETSDDQSEDRQSEDRGDDDGEQKPKRARRGRRGGRRNRNRSDDASTETESGDEETVAETEPAPEPAEAPAEAEAEAAPAKPKRTRRRKADAVAEESTETAEPVAAAPEPEAEAEAKPKRKPRARKPKADAEAPEEAAPEAVEAEAPAKPKRRRKAATVEAEAEPATETPAPAANDSNGTESDGETGEDGSPRRGWWQRTFGN